MSKYEIMIVVDGTLKEIDAKKVFLDSKNLIIQTKKIEVNEMGHRDLAYPIDKKTSGYYFVLNFDCEDPTIIAEFRRLTLLNKNIIRHLIINLEKDYGYKATQNPKKVKKSQYRKGIYEKVTSKIDEERERIVKIKDGVPVKLTDI